nr:CapA family protein [Clostridia bacterium]
MLLKYDFNCDYETKYMTPGMREFVDRMNWKAKMLGMDSSHFVNPYGGSAFGWNEVTCMDLLRLGRHAYGMPLVMDSMSAKGDLPIHIYGEHERDVVIHRDYQEIFDEAYQRIHEGENIKNPHTVYAGKGGGWGSGPHKTFCFLGYAKVEGRNVLAAVANISAPRAIGRIYRMNTFMELLDICACAIRGEDVSGMKLKYGDLAAATLLPEDGTPGVILKKQPFELLYACRENEVFHPASISKVLTVVTGLDMIGSNQEMFRIEECDICNDSDYWAYPGDIETVETAMIPIMVKSNGSDTLAFARYCGEKILAEKSKWGAELHPTEKPKKTRKDPTSIAFTGDISFDRYMEGHWNDADLLDEKVMDFFRSSDHVVANVEGALIIPPQEDVKSGQFVHAMDPAAATFLERIGSDIWCIGNNHTMDSERRGLSSTLAIADAFGCGTLGAGLDLEHASEPVYIDEAGGIGLFGVAYLNECV